MNGKKIKAVVFDLGNVLIPFDYNVAVTRLNTIEATLGDRFIAFYQTNYHLHRALERGDIGTGDFLQLMLQALHNKIDEELFCRIYAEIFSVNQNVADLLPVLKKNYRLILLSNTNEIHMKYGWEHYPFLLHFDKLILSHEVKAVKPEAKLYEAVELFTGLLPGEHIFIDDIEEYVDGAKKRGWDGIQFLGYESLVNELRERKILEERL